MKSIEIVVHCFSEKRTAFASLLTAQLSSLMLWPRNSDILVTVTICCLPSDNLVRRVVDAFWMKGLICGTHLLPPSKLFRRAIGRNEVAKASIADIVWHADADYLFGDGCLDSLAALQFTGLVFPCNAQIHRSHAIGDAEIARIKPGELFGPDLSLFEPWGCKIAIGGLQIVPGDLARRGYLDGTKWTEPVESATDFLDTKEDKHYREACGGSQPIELVNLFRMRHSESAFEPAEKRLAQTAWKT